MDKSSIRALLKVILLRYFAHRAATDSPVLTGKRDFLPTPWKSPNLGNVSSTSLEDASLTWLQQVLRKDSSARWFRQVSQ